MTKSKTPRATAARLSTSLQGNRNRLRPGQTEPGVNRSIRFTPAEIASYEALATEKGLTLSQLARELLAAELGRMIIRGWRPPSVRPRAK